MSPLVKLDGGPFEGAKVDTDRGQTLSLRGRGVPEGHVARYTLTRDRGVYRFRGLSKVLATLPLPGANL